MTNNLSVGIDPFANQSFGTLQSQQISIPNNSLNTSKLQNFSWTNRDDALNMVKNGVISVDEANRLLASPIKRITADELATNNSNNTNSSVSSYDAQLAAANALKAQRTGEAQSIKNSMMGQRDKVTEMLNTILGNIEKVYGEEKSKRDEKRDEDSAELLAQLEKALPGIGSSFAAIGAYDSSWNNDAQADTKEEHNKAQDEIQKEYDADMTTLGNKRNQAKTDAQNSYNNFMADFDTFDGTEANSDNLETLRASKNSLTKAMNDFNAQGDYYKPGSRLQNEMSSLGNYNGQKTIDAFSSFLNTAGAGGSGVKAGNENTTSIAAKNKNKNEKSELEQNKATGVAK